MNLKILADNITEFLHRYKDVEDVFTDKRGIEILSDLCCILDLEPEFTVKKVKTENKDGEQNEQI